MFKSKKNNKLFNDNNECRNAFDIIKSKDWREKLFEGRNMRLMGSLFELQDIQFNEAVAVEIDERKGEFDSHKKPSGEPAFTKSSQDWNSSSNVPVISPPKTKIKQRESSQSGGTRSAKSPKDDRALDKKSPERGRPGAKKQSAKRVRAQGHKAERDALKNASENTNVNTSTPTGRLSEDKMKRIKEILHLFLTENTTINKSNFLKTITEGIKKHFAKK
jgi:hypothetical protein